MSISRDFITSCLGGIYRPKDTRPISEWARENIVLEAGENRMMAGTPFDIRNAPYNKIVFDFLQCPRTRELIEVKSSQVGLTLTVYVGMAWMVKHEPGNCMYVARDLLAVRELGKQRLTPILKQISKEIQDEIEDRNQTCVTKSINGATLRLVGAQSAQGFVSWPCSLGCVDEAETHPDLPEGTTIALTRARFKGDDNYKLIAFSKPQDQPIYEADKETKKPRLVSGQGTRLMDEYYSGTQEKFHVPCPHCGHRQELVWEQMKLDPGAITSASGVLPVEYDREAVKDLTYYECEGCKGRILDRHKRKIVPMGDWVPTPPEKRQGPYKTAYPGRRSVQISDLYVFLFGTVHWGLLMLKWLEAQGDGQKLDAFYNDHLGLPRPERKSSGRVELTNIDRLISPYHRVNLYDSGRRWRGVVETLDFEPLFIGIGVDKQKDFLKYVIAAFDERGEVHVLDWNYLATDDDLTHLLENFRVKSPSGGEFRIYAGLMDSGYLGSRVVEYCYRIRGTIRYFVPSRGIQRAQAKMSYWMRTDGESVPGREVQIIHFDSQSWEDELYRHRILDFRPGRPSHRLHPRIHLPMEAAEDEDFRQELANAQHAEVIKRGIPTGVWAWGRANPNQPNDFADCIKQILILWPLHSPDDGEPEDEPEPEEPT